MTAVRRLVARLGDPGGLRACYEAGPTGYELHRLLLSMGVACDVVAPALIPRRARDRIKTDRRDAQRLARLHRTGERAALTTAVALTQQGAIGQGDIVR
jgi:transposase